MTPKSKSRAAPKPIIIQMMYDAIPGPQAPKDDRVGGAYVIAYIREQDVSKAVITELEMAKANGWIVQSVQEAQVRKRSEMKDASSRSLFDEASSTGESRRFYCYPAPESPSRSRKKARRSR